MKNEKKPIIILQVDEDVKSKVKELAKKHDRSVSSYIRWLILEAVEKQTNGK